MIRRLVAYAVRTALDESQRYWLTELFEKGFTGYENFSDRRLRRELELRGLAQSEDTLDDEEELEAPTLDALNDTLAQWASGAERMD
jgi:hypothetical protein